MPLFVTGDTVVATIFPFCTANPATHGQHRLGWWLAGRDRNDTPLWRLIGATMGTTERLLSGELKPGDEMAARIEEATSGAVLAIDWDCDGPIEWRDEPAPRRVN